MDLSGNPHKHFIFKASNARTIIKSSPGNLELLYFYSRKIKYFRKRE